MSRLNRSRGRAAAAMWLLSITSAVCAFAFTEARYQALGFGDDYSFYLGLAERVGDAHRPQTLVFHPSGWSVLGFAGLDGERSIHQAVHFDPVKYLYPLVLKAVDHPLALMVLMSVGVASPLMYMAALAPRAASQSGLIVALAVVYAANPLVYLSAADDLHPFALLSPLFLIALLAIHFRRSHRERLAWFNVLFLVREEALILGLFLMALLYLEAVREEGSLRARVRRVAPFLLSWAIWCVVIFSYFAWTEYPNDLAVKLGTSRLPPALIALGASLVFIWRAKRTWFSPELLLFVWLLGAVLLQIVQYLLSWAGLGDYVYFPYTLLAWVLLIGAALQWASDRPSMARTVQRIAFVVAAGLVLAWFPSPLAPYPLWKRYRGSRESAAFVFMAARDLPRDAAILTDFPTLHAFHRFDRAYAYEQLPLSVAPVAELAFPDNRRILEDLLRQRIEYAVIANDTVPRLADLTATAGVDVELMGKGERFSSYRIAR